MEEAVLEREEEVQEIESLHTHTNIQKNNHYKILKLVPNHATILLEAAKCETVKESGMIYDGVLFSAAIFAAAAAVNEPNTFLIGISMDMLNPIKDSDDITFEATANSTSSGKKNVDVLGKINDIAFMQGSFILLKLDEKSLIKQKN